LPGIPVEEVSGKGEEGEERVPLVIGEQLPKPAVDKGAKQNKQAKKAGNNKD
jgi:hypothetical protein